MSDDSVLDINLNNCYSENHNSSTDSSNSSTTDTAFLRSETNRMDSCIRISSFICLIALFVGICLFNFSYQQNSKIIQKDVIPLFDTSFSNISYKLDDSFDGDLGHISDAIEKNELVFIYLYANWCARSHKFKKLIEDLASKYSNTISFHAVNCFNNEGTCRNHFNLHKYPQIAFQIRNVGLFYYQGPFEFTYISKYIDLMQAPLTRIDSLDEFATFIINNDGAVVGNFNFSEKNDSKMYNIFYQSAIKTYHTNFENPTRFVVILNNTLTYDLQHLDPKLKNVYSSDKKITYFSVFGLQEYYQLSIKKLSVDDLSFWVKMAIKRSLNWIYPDKYEMNFENRNRLLIFMQKFTNDTTLDDPRVVRKEFAIGKNVAIQNRLSGMKIKQPQTKNQFLNLIINKLETSFETRRLKCCHKYQFEELYMPPVFKSNFCKNSSINPNINAKFARSFDVYLMDKNLYVNYANNLLNEYITKKFSGNKPIVLFVDYKNESLFVMEKRFNYRNLKEFIHKQKNGLNKRFVKNDQAVLRSQHDNFAQNINSKDLNQLIDNPSNSEFLEQDTLVFYYARWCGYCKLLNFKLMKLMHHYFRNVKSIKLLKINGDSNDFSWITYSSTIPSLLLIPAHLAKTDFDKTIESYSYDLSVAFNETNLLSFILLNSKNPLTIMDFLKENFINPKILSDNLVNTKERNRLRNMFTELILKRLNKLTLNSNLLTSKLTSIDQSFNGTSTMFFDGSLDYIGYFNNYKTFLSNKLDKFIHEIYLLKQFEELFL